jgi:hypothetical protein
MTNYFTKLNLSIDVLDIESMNKTPIRSFRNYTSYYDISENDRYDYLHTLFAPFEPVNVVWGNFPSARPHIDHDGVLTSINHYYNTLDAQTIFYEPKENVKPFCGEGETVPNYYNKEDIIEQSRFCANVNDVYMLNVNCIHSLEFSVKGTRKMIKWMFKIPYDEIYQELKNKKICL